MRIVDPIPSLVVSLPPDPLSIVLGFLSVPPLPVLLPVRDEALGEYDLIPLLRWLRCNLTKIIGENDNKDSK